MLVDVRGRNPYKEMEEVDRYHVLDELLAQSARPGERRRGREPAAAVRWAPLEPEESEIPQVRAPAPAKREAPKGGEHVVQVAGQIAAPAEPPGLRTRLLRQRVRNRALQKQLEEARAGLADCEEQLRQLRAQLAESEQDRAYLREQRATLQARAEEERLRRNRAELELERLKGRLVVLKPLLEGLGRAAAELGAVVDTYQERRPPVAPPTRPQPPSGAEESAREGGFVKAIADAVEHWRGPGPRPAG